MVILVGIQARSNSKRLPEKIYLPINGKPMLQYVVESALEVNVMSKAVQIIVAVLGPKGDKKLKDWCEVQYGYNYCAPDCDENDVLTRYQLAASHYDADAIVRVTGDCPLIPPTIIARCVESLSSVDYSSNTVIRTYREGFDVQGCSTEALQWFSDNATQREHLFQEFDENAAVRDAFVEKCFTYQHILNRTNEILHKTSIDTLEEYKRLNAQLSRTN